MELLVFGHRGARVLVFPTSMGRFYEWEDHGMIAPLLPYLSQGCFQLFCLDSLDVESWYAADRPPAERALRHLDYDRYLGNEVLPFTRNLNPDPYLACLGASFGAFQAGNFAFRRPEEVNRLVALNGYYHLQYLGVVDDDPAWPDGYTDPAVYANDPCQYLAGELDPRRREALARMKITLATGENDRGRPNNELLSSLLRAQGIPHTVDVWRGGTHDWEAWRRMIQRYLL